MTVMKNMSQKMNNFNLQIVLYLYCIVLSEPIALEVIGFKTNIISVPYNLCNMKCWIFNQLFK